MTQQGTVKIDGKHSSYEGTTKKQMLDEMANNHSSVAIENPNDKPSLFKALKTAQAADETKPKAQENSSERGKGNKPVVTPKKDRPKKKHFTDFRFKQLIRMAEKLLRRKWTFIDILNELAVTTEERNPIKAIIGIARRNIAELSTAEMATEKYYNSEEGNVDIFDETLDIKETAQIVKDISGSNLNVYRFIDAIKNLRYRSKLTLAIDLVVEYGKKKGNSIHGKGNSFELANTIQKANKSEMTVKLIEDAIKNLRWEKRQQDNQCFDLAETHYKENSDDNEHPAKIIKRCGYSVKGVTDNKLVAIFYRVRDNKGLSKKFEDMAKKKRNQLLDSGRVPQKKKKKLNKGDSGYGHDLKSQIQKYQYTAKKSG